MSWRVLKEFCERVRVTLTLKIINNKRSGPFAYTRSVDSFHQLPHFKTFDTVSFCPFHHSRVMVSLQHGDKQNNFKHTLKTRLTRDNNLTLTQQDCEITHYMHICSEGENKPNMPLCVSVCVCVCEMVTEETSELSCLRYQHVAAACCWSIEPRYQSGSDWIYTFGGPEWQQSASQCRIASWIYRSIYISI